MVAAPQCCPGHSWLIRDVTKKGAPTRSCTGLKLAYRASASLTMLWGLSKWSARDELHVQGCLILSQVGLLLPVDHAPKKMVSLTGFAPVISWSLGHSCSVL